LAFVTGRLGPLVLTAIIDALQDHRCSIIPVSCWKICRQKGGDAGIQKPFLVEMLRTCPQRLLKLHINMFMMDQLHEAVQNYSKKG